MRRNIKYPPVPGAGLPDAERRRGTVAIGALGTGRIPRWPPARRRRGPTPARGRHRSSRSECRRRRAPRVASRAATTRHPEACPPSGGAGASFGASSHPSPCRDPTPGRARASPRPECGDGRPSYATRLGSRSCSGSTAGDLDAAKLRALYVHVEDGDVAMPAVIGDNKGARQRARALRGEIVGWAVVLSADRWKE